MKKFNKLYLSLGLLLSLESVTYAHQEESVTTESIVDIKEQEQAEQTLQEIDAELCEIFSKFFDEKDTMPFSKIVTKVVAILKIKRNLLHESEQAKCDEIMKSFEKNKYNTNFAVWAKILIAPELMSLMSEKTRAYISGVSTNVKIKSLIYKLKNNNSHSFF